MKTSLIFAAAALAGAPLFGATTEVESTTTLGVVKYGTDDTFATDKSGKEVVVAVPWLEANSSATTVSVTNLITSGLTSGDKISVWDESTKTYTTWAYNGSTWTAAQNANNATPATTIAPGQAFWYNRAGEKTFTLIGRVPTNAITTTVNKGTGISGKKYNLVSNPYRAAVDFAKVTGCAANDQLIVITGGTTTTTTTYTYNGSKWCQGGNTTTTNNRGTEMITYNPTKTPLDTLVIPAGASFWYMSATGEPTINWQSIVSE